MGHYGEQAKNQAMEKSFQVFWLLKCLYLFIVNKLAVATHRDLGQGPTTGT
jgi:hypothetical protein